MNNLNRSMSSVKIFKSWVMRKMDQRPSKIDLGAVRISPVDSPLRLKEQFIPLSRTTVVRKLSQDTTFISKSNEILFERLCRYLDACILNRHSILLQQLSSSYEHLNPDVELIIDGHKFTSFRRQILDDEFSFIQKFNRLCELCNFVEMNKEQLEKWLCRDGGVTAVQSWLESGDYDLLKMWLLGRDNDDDYHGENDYYYKKKKTVKGAVKKLVAKYWPLQTLFNPFQKGNLFKRVVVAVRMKNSDKVDLKMFKNVTEGQLVHIVPQVTISNSKLDNSLLAVAGGFFAMGLCSNLLLPTVTIESGWLLTSASQLTSLLTSLSAVVGIIQWTVIQKKRSHYWQWRSELNYQSIVANNRGVVTLLGERAQEEIFKEAVLSYMMILRHRADGVASGGVSQSKLESEVDSWAVSNLDTSVDNIKIDLSEALSLLRQLGLVTMDSSDSNYLSAVSLQTAVAILGAEFQANNMVDSDGSTVVMTPLLHHNRLEVEERLPAEGYEKLRVTGDAAKEDEDGKASR